MSLPRCAVCNGQVIDGVCLQCGRSPLPDRVSLGEALLSNVTPEDAAGDAHGMGYGPRQRPTLSESVERARAWARGKLA